MIVLDTNVLSALMRPALNPHVVAWFSQQEIARLRLTVISIEELAYGIVRMPNSKKKRILESGLSALEQSSLGTNALVLTKEAAHRSAAARAGAKRATGHCDVPDAMIAGIALANGASVATRNVSHFQHFGVPLIDPWQ